MKKKLILSTGILFSMLVAGNCYAAAGDIQGEFKLDEMVVTASRIEKKDIDVPAMTQVYNEKDIERTGATNVMDFMYNVLGAEVLDTTAPAKNGVHFRGTGSSSRMRTSALIMLNGTPINIQGRADISAIPVTAIKRIEVLNGGGSVLYGTDALDGMVNIILKDTVKNRLYGGFGTHGYREGGIAIQADKLSLAYDGRKISERGHDGILGNSNVPTKVRYGGKYDSSNYFAHLVPDEHLDVVYMQRDYSNDYFYRGPSGYNDPDAESRLLNVKYKNKNLNVSTYWKDYELSIVNDKTGLTTDNWSKVYGIDINNKFDIGKASVIVGGNFDSERMAQTKGTYRRTQDTTAIYMLLDAPVSEKTSVSVGGRQVYISDLGNKFCPQFNVLHKLDENSSLFLNVNKAFRTPLAEELFGNAGHGYTGNLALRPEEGWLSEIGWKKQFDDKSVKIAVFNMDIKNRISKDATKTFVNNDKFKNTGVEALYEQNIDSKWKYNVGMTYSNPKEKSAAKGWTQADYKFMGTAGIHYQLDKYNASLNVQYYGLQTPSSKDKDAVNFNFNMGYKFDKNSSVIFRVKNIADSDKSFESCGSQLPKRAVSLTYYLDF